jgi:EAL domain-containing protein (putative c-di-GMP-specific phosphodiesterase class I)
MAAATGPRLTAVARSRRLASWLAGSLFLISAGAAIAVDGLTHSTVSLIAVGLLAVAAAAALVMFALRRSTTARHDEPAASPGLRAAIVDELTAALAAGEFDVAYQPITRIDESDSITAVEALFRWESAIAPDIVTAALIGLAEETGLITELGFCVLDRACREAHRLQEAAGHLITVHVNVCGIDLLTAGYLDEVDAILAGTRWPADQLVLEVTERVAEADASSAVSVLRALRTRGIGIAIDDFGAGYSSLGRINELPVSLLKLDASFTAGAMSPPLLKAIVSLGAALDLPIIAEGIETPQQAAVLRDCGFTLGQGYLLGRPLELASAVTSLAGALR